MSKAVEEWEEIKSEAYEFEKAGDELIGLYLGIEESPVYEDSWLVRLQDTKSEGIVGFWANMVLKHKLDLCKMGESIKIRYLGEVESKKGRKYKDYKVFKLKG